MSSSIGPATQEGGLPTPVHGRALGLARLAWWLIVGAIVVLILVAIPLNLEYYHELCQTTPCVAQQLTPQQMQNWLARGLTLDFYAAYVVALSLISTFAFVLVALIIILRKPDDRVALFVSFTLAIFGGATVPAFFDILSQANALWWLPTRLLGYIGSVSILAFLYLFPSGAFVPRWTRVVFVLSAVEDVPNFFFKGTPLQLPDWLDFILFPAFLISGMFAQLYRYRRVSNVTERQQTKWVVYGVTIALGGLLILFAIDFLFSPPADNMILVLIARTLFVGFVTLIPISVGISILRSRLWDIDLLINRTLVYVPLSAILAGIFAATITLSQKVSVALTGGESDATTVFTTLVVVAAFTPLKDRLQALVDRGFKEAADPAKKLKAFREQVQSRMFMVDAEQITRRLVEAAVAAFEACGGAVYLGAEAQALPFYTCGEWNGEAKLSVPLENNGGRWGWLALGARRQGAVYTRQDGELLQQVASVVARAIEPAPPAR
jgi:hypothetical protein